MNEKKTRQTQKNERLSTASIVLVEWDDGRREAFGSISAIYDTHTAEEIGCNRERLWNCSITADKPKHTKTGATIYRLPLYRKARK